MGGLVQVLSIDIPANTKSLAVNGSAFVLYVPFVAILLAPGLQLHFQNNRLS